MVDQRSLPVVALDGYCASCSSTATTSPLQPETSGGYRPRRHPSRFVALLSRGIGWLKARPLPDIGGLWGKKPLPNSSDPRDSCLPVASRSRRNPPSCSWLSSEG